MKTLVLFDLDGVIFCEDGYFACAALSIARFFLQKQPQWLNDVVHPDQVATKKDVEQIRNIFLPDDILDALRQKAINNNWDKAFVCVAGLDAITTPCLEPSDIREHLALWLSLHKSVGQAFLHSVAELKTSYSFAKASLFDEVKSVFQRCYLGDAQAQTKLLQQGLIEQETTVIAVDEIACVLRSLTSCGMVLGVGTGRPREEALRPLQSLGLLPFFDRIRVSTHDDVRLEEAKRQLPPGSLGKPHPFVYQRAAFDYEPRNTVIVGDSPADALAANAAGFTFYGVGTEASFGTNALIAQAVFADIRSLPAALGCNLSDPECYNRQEKR